MSIRSDVKTAIEGSITAPVKDTQSFPNLTKNLPVVIVENPTNEATNYGTNDTDKVSYKVTSEIQIAVVVAEADNWHDEAEAIMNDVRTALFTDSSWHGTYDWGGDYTEEYALAEPEGSRAVGIGTMNFTINNIVEYTIT